MNDYLETSFIVKTYTLLYKYFLSSFTCRIFSILSNICKESKTNHYINRYLHKSSTLRYSFVYKVYSEALSSVNKFFDMLYRFIALCANDSSVINYIRKTFFSSNNLAACSLFILFFSCALSITSILIGTFNYMKAILLVLGLLVSAALLASKTSWNACRKNSLALRVILYIFD